MEGRRNRTDSQSGEANIQLCKVVEDDTFTIGNFQSDRPNHFTQNDGVYRVGSYPIWIEKEKVLPGLH